MGNLCLVVWLIWTKNLEDIALSSETALCCLLLFLLCPAIRLQIKTFPKYITKILMAITSTVFRNLIQEDVKSLYYTLPFRYGSLLIRRTINKTSIFLSLNILMDISLSQTFMEILKLNLLSTKLSFFSL